MLNKIKKNKKKKCIIFYVVIYVLIFHSYQFFLNISVAKPVRLAMS